MENVVRSPTNVDLEKSKNYTEDLLKRYFVKSDIKKGEYYYDGRKRREFYNIIEDKIYDFKEEVINLAKDYIRVNIKMIEKRPKEVKMVIAGAYGHLLEDLNMTIFDFMNNLHVGKYAGNMELLTKDGLNCMNHKFTDYTPKIVDQESQKKMWGELLPKYRSIKDRVDDKDIEQLKDIKYNSICGKDVSQLTKTLYIYLGCEVVMVSNFEWLEHLHKR